MAELSRRTVLGAAAATAASLGLTGTPVWANGAPEGFDAGLFATPPADSRPTILWFWNGTVTPDLVDAHAGRHARPAAWTRCWSSRSTPPRSGRRSSARHGSRIIEHALREAQRHGMRVWLFNDDFFPSGRAGGFVVNGGTVGDRTYPPRPDLRTKGVAPQRDLVARRPAVPLAGRGSCSLAVSDGRLVVDAARVRRRPRAAATAPAGPTTTSRRPSGSTAAPRG